MAWVFWAFALLLFFALLIGAAFLAGRFPQRGRWFLFFTAVILGVALDLASKSYAFQQLPYLGQSHEVFSWFAFTHARNEGAAFGLFQGQVNFFMLVSIVAFVAIPYFVHTVQYRARTTALVLGLILAGVLGNFWDRVVFGYVRDFLDVHTPPTGAVHDFFVNTIGRTIWPTFNVADMFITTGAISIILFLSRTEPEEEEAESEAESEARGPTPEAEAESEAESEARGPTPEARDPTPEAEAESEARGPTPEARGPTPEDREPTPEDREPTPEDQEPGPPVIVVVKDKSNEGDPNA